MSDWRAFVRNRLKLEGLRPERSEEITEDLARQLEDIYQAARARGCTEAEARALCRDHVPDWEAFSRRLSAEDRSASLDPLQRRQRRREDQAAAGGFTLWGELSRDLIFAVRTLGRRPPAPLLATVTIAVAIAATTSIFSVVNGILLSDLSYEDPESLVMVWEHNVPRNGLTNPVSPANFLDWRDEAPAFSSMALLAETSGTLTGEPDPERVGVMIVSATLFPLLGVQPVVGRVFRPEEDVAGASATALLSHAFWRRRYGADPAIVGGSIILNGSPVEVIGVLPPGFGFPMRWVYSGTGSQDVWTTPRWGDEAREATGRWLQVVGRLRRGETVSSAQASMDALAGQLRERRPQSQAGWEINVVGLFEEFVGETRTTLIVLFGAALFVLLIACANVANLMLSKAAGRFHEMSVRAALGAGRYRLIRQLMTESLLIAAVGGVVGAAFGFWLLQILLSMAPDTIPRLDRVVVDWRVLLFASALVLATGLLFGLAPAVRTSRADPALALRGGAIRGGSNRTAGRYVLVGAEIALCLILLVGAGLLVRAFGGLTETSVGFDTDRLLTFTLELEDREAAERADFFDQLVDRIEAVPGVVGAGAGAALPLVGTGSATSFWVNDRPRPADADIPVADVRWVDHRFLQRLGVPLLAGRYFETTDTADSGLKVVVSQALAEEFWPGQSAIGKTLSMPWNGIRVGEIVGVAGDVRHRGPAVGPRSKIYWYHRQFQAYDYMGVVVRTVGEPAQMLPQIRRIVSEMDETLALYNVGTMEASLSGILAPSRFSMTLLSLFAAVGLLLAAGGIYGVMSCAVTERSRELGIRLALGAERSQVRRMVLRRGAIIVAAALAVGAGGALTLSRFIEAMLFGVVEASDPMTFGAVVLLLAAVALAACYLPARRASRVDPLETLRYE